jgi:hypothetical protein
MGKKKSTVAPYICLHNWQTDGYRESGDGRYILEESCREGCGRTRERTVHGS